MANNQDPRNIFVNQRADYSDGKQEQFYDKQPQRETPVNNTPKDDYTARVEEMKRLAAKYEREGEGQLVKDIVNNVIEQKARGNLTNDQLIAFAKRVTPLLNAEQRLRLNGLLEELLKL